MKTKPLTETYPFLRGGGEMGELIRSYNWAETSLGSPTEWPHALKISLSNVLHSGFPMFLFWGPDLICFYNDAFRPSLGQNGKHPAIGKKGKVVWQEIWSFIGPLITNVMQSGKPVWFENQLVPFYRNGRIEDIYWTFSYSLVTDDEGGAGGVLVTCMETTQSVHAIAQIKESEAKLRNIIDEVPVAIGLTRGEGFVFENINAPMLQIINKKNSAEVIGKPIEEVLPEFASQPVYSSRQDILNKNETFFGTEIEAEFFKEGVLQKRFFDITYKRIADGEAPPAVLHIAKDVTEQVQIRRQTKQSEAKLRSILNSAPTAIGVFVGPELIVENPNQLLIELMAAGPDIEGKSFRQLLSGLVEEDNKFIQLIDSVRSSGQPFEGQEIEVYFKKEKKNRYFNINFIPLRDDNGSVYAVLDVSVDVTGQVVARKKVEQSETKFRMLIEEAPFATALYTGSELTIDIVNDAMLRMWNRPEGVVGRKLEEALPELQGQPFADLLREVFHTGKEYVARGHPATLLLNGKLEQRWYDFNYKPLHDEAGDIYGIVHMAIDVTEQVIARQELEDKEKALESALEQVRLSKEAAELGTFDLNLEHNTMHWDDRCRTLFGISHHGPVTYEHDFLEGLHPEDRERIETIIQNCFIKSVSNGDYDVEYRTIGMEDKIVRWVRAKGKVYFDDNDRPVRFVGSVLDITTQVDARQRVESLVTLRTKELADANENLSNLNKELQRSNQNLEEFAHAASHDLKEPIRKIHFFTQQLKDQLSDHLQENEQRSFNRIVNSTERMGHLIDDLLLYSHVSHRPHEMESVDLNEKLQRILEDLELDIEEKKASFQIEALPVVQGYKRQLQQLFQNLITNSLKYSKREEAPAIRIEARLTEVAGKQYHMISVTDNGIGFDQEYEDKIFQMFARLHGKSEYSGTGVGLSIVKKVVENHHGFIRVRSTSGIGSTFEIFLPEQPQN